jgi:hypothetical protein
MKKKIFFLTAVATLSLTTATIAQNVPNYVPTNGLVGWWPFNGNANDESGNNNNGTVNGASLTSDRFGNNNSAFFFNSDNQNINCGNSTNLGLTINTSLTLNYWTLSTNNKWPYISKYQNLNPSNCNYAVGNDNQNFIVTGNGLNSAQVQSNSNTNWVNLCFVFNGLTDSVSTYINGTFIQKDYVILSSNVSTNNLLFGPRFNPLTSNYQIPNGNLDDIGIWNRALTEQEISDLYNANICYQTVTVTDTLIINTNLVGFNPVTYQNTIKIYPNPTNDHITINYGNFATLSGYQLKIENSLGQQVFQTNINQQSSYLNLSTWGGNGIYFVRIIDPQGNTVDIRKIVLQ